MGSCCSIFSFLFSVLYMLSFCCLPLYWLSFDLWLLITPLGIFKHFEVSVSQKTMQTGNIVIFLKPYEILSMKYLWPSTINTQNIFFQILLFDWIIRVFWFIQYFNIQWSQKQWILQYFNLQYIFYCIKCVCLI